MGKKKSTPDPERPLCGSCGKPAHYYVTIDVQDLELARSDRFGDLERRWTPGYQGGGTRISQRLCKDCLRSSIKINVTAAAELKGETDT